ncbi:MAG: universal stress protein [Candidatus Rokubacteria bacterium]|nr:universal stress protein [Candidatus Rokubacteria bacterium]
MTFRRILVPVDFSASSDHALDEAVRLAKQLDARLWILHVVEIPLPGWPVYGREFSPEALIEKGREGAAQQLEVLASRVSPLEVEPLVRVGTPFVEIIAAAREIGADLIVMGTHGRTGLAHALIGSVTEKVVRASPCPVLTIRHPSLAVPVP